MHNFSIYKDTTFSQTHHNKTPTKQTVFTNSQNPKFTKPPLPLIASEKPPASNRGKRFCRLHHLQKNAPNTGRFSVLAIHRQFAHK